MDTTKLSALTLFFSVFFQGLTVLALSNETLGSEPTVRPSFYRTSFDCTKAEDESIEKTICQNEELAKLDLEMADAYRNRLKSVTASQKSELVLSQKKWLRIRNSYDVNPYHGDPVGTLSDLSDFYRNRILALRSSQMNLLNTKIPQEYDWLKTILPKGFSKEFSISRGHMSCDNPCEKKPSLYKLLSIGGGGIGKPPGDVDTPYTKTVSKLNSEGWTKCKTTGDGKLITDYFKKKHKMITIRRYYSMGVGNGINLSITISGSLPEKPSPIPPNPVITITSDWITYSNPDVGFQVQYPPDWHIIDNSAPNIKYLIFGAGDFTGDFRVSIQPKEYFNKTNKRCLPSSYRISGYPAQICPLEYESDFEGTCIRHIASIDIETDKYYLSFEPDFHGSFAEGPNQYKLTDLYEKILSTIKMK